jgi:transcription antitermination factor NusG
MGKKFIQFKVNLDGLETVARWYTIVTIYNYEQKVAGDINKLILEEALNGIAEESFCGIRETKEEYLNKNGEKKTKIKNEKVLANYVFIKTKMNPRVWAMLTNITGVSAILCTSGVPVSTPDSKIAHIKEILAGGEEHNVSN